MSEKCYAKLFFAFASLKYFCEQAKLLGKKKIEIDYVLKVLNEVLGNECN